MSSFEAPVPKKENLGGNIIIALPEDSLRCFNATSCWCLFFLVRSDLIFVDNETRLIFGSINQLLSASVQR